MKRRVFLKNSALAVGATAALPLAARAGERPRPDLLLIMPDQMRGDCLSALNHPAVRTPQFDELAREGVLFRRAYATVASCIPARYALLSGLCPQTSGVVGFSAKPFVTPTLPGLLGNAGYETALIGRTMHQPEASGSCGYGKSVLGSTYVDHDAYDKFLREAAPESGGIRAVVEKLGVTFNHWQAKPWPLADELHPTEWGIAQSRKAVAEADPRRPLFLTTSFYAPHPPLFPPRPFFDRYHSRQDLPFPAHGDWVKWESLSPQGDRTGHRVRLEGELLRAAQAGYFGLIEHLDRQVSSLVRDFKARSEQAGRPWVIVVVSDHGEMLGDHGYFRKCEPYEGSANIPFIISGSPELGFKAGLTLHRPVCLEDLLPTLLSLAGGSPPRVDGINLVPALRGEKSVIREWLHLEHAPCYGEDQAYQALTDGRFKYIWRTADGSEQLFDLDEDPREEHDLAANENHAALLAEWRARLAQRLAGRPEGFAKEGRLIPGRPYLPLNAGTI